MKHDYAQLLMVREENPALHGGEAYAVESFSHLSSNLEIRRTSTNASVNSIATGVVSAAVS
jgi:hypothetical protein